MSSEDGKTDEANLPITIRVRDQVSVKMLFSILQPDTLILCPGQELHQKFVLARLCR